MIFDDEQDIINLIQHHLDYEDILLFNGNSYEKKLLRYLRDSDSLTPNNAHNALPPDYISVKNNYMFDVMRVNDTEVNKKYNPVKIRERQLEKELRKSWVGELLSPNTRIICNSESSDIAEHSYKNYLKNVKRVMTEHIKKIPIWEKENPIIKNKGLLVFDETECCFEGSINYAYGETFLYAFKDNPILHEPWNDKEFIEQAYSSELDFIIWACPYKSNSAVPRNANIWFPYLTIIDVRYPRTRPYKKYEQELLAL